MSYKAILVVGAGISGAVAARQLVDTRPDCQVTVIDKNLHVAGNCYDYINERNVRVHKYGPHLLHHGSDMLHAFLSRFTDWLPYEHHVEVLLPSGKVTDFPVNRRTVEDLLNVKFADEAAFQLHMANSRMQYDHEPSNADEVFLASVGEQIANVLFRPYTHKMWGVEATQIDAAVGARIPVRSGYDNRYFSDKYQLLPANGYTAMIERMLCHERITVLLNKQCDDSLFDSYDKVYSTMPIDALCGYALGKLPYRSIQFKHTAGLPAVAASAAVLNFTFADGPTRRTYWNKLPGHANEQSTAACYTTETPCEPSISNEQSYPVRNATSLKLFTDYEALVQQQWHGKVISFGRLGSFAYQDMHVAALAALQLIARENQKHDT
jgi:UDP-galactopyranose mutase